MNGFIFALSEIFLCPIIPEREYLSAALIILLPVISYLSLIQCCRFSNMSFVGSSALAALSYLSPPIDLPCVLLLEVVIVYYFLRRMSRCWSKLA